MSRFTEYDDFEDPTAILAMGRWVSHRNNVLNGKPGKAKLRELERALVNLPTKRLIEGSMCDGKGVCPTGAMAYQALRDQGYEPKAAWKKLKWRPRHDNYLDGELDFTKEYAVEHLGMTRTLAEVIAYENDEGTGWRSGPLWRDRPGDPKLRSLRRRSHQYGGPPRRSHDAEERYEAMLAWVQSELRK